MTKRQRVELELSSKRSAINAALAKDELSDEERSALDADSKRAQELEVELRACIVSGEGEPKLVGEDGLDAEQRERLQLRRKASVLNYLTAYTQGRVVDGAEQELSAAAQVGAGRIPLEIFDLPAENRTESRADVTTPAPTTNTSVNLQPIFPQVFARSVLPRLGVQMPRVESGGYATGIISTGQSAAAVAKAAAKESTAGAITTKSTEPHRVTARMSITLEDRALIGPSNFEARIRESTMLALSDQLDKLGLNGDPSTTAAEPQGLLSQLADPANPSDVIDFDGFVKLAADGIDGGPWAEGLGDVRLLVNAQTMRLAESTFQTTSGSKGELAAASYLRQHAGAFFASSRMPGTASNIAQALRVRMATMGLDGVNATTLAVCPTWNYLAIDDPFTDAGSGVSHYTISALVGDVVIVQTAAYERVDVKVS